MLDMNKHATLRLCNQLKKINFGPKLFQIHRVLMPRNQKESSLVRRSLVYFVHADRDAVINKPLVYQDGVEKDFQHAHEDQPITAYQHARRKWDNTY